MSDPLPPPPPPAAAPADDPAVLARTSVDCARMADLTTYARVPGGQSTTRAALRPRADGSVDVLVGPASEAARNLLARPIATVRVASPGCEPVLLHGAARRVRGLSSGGRLVFHVEAAAIRVGRRNEPVDEPRYATAAPDPLRHDAPAVLEHLNSGHREALSACLRARGCDAQLAEAVRLDAEGLTVIGIGSFGVETVRLDFGRRTTSLAQLPVGLHSVLTPQSACPHAGPGPEPTL